VDARVAAGILVIAVLAGCVAWCSNRPRWRPAAFGLSWFILGLLPASSVFPLAEVTNDHRMFFAYIGLTLAVVSAAARAAEAVMMRQPAYGRAVRTAAAVLVIAIVLAHGVGTYARNEVFRSGETLWRDTAEKSPRNGRALMNYGLTLMSRGQLVEARATFERARVFTPHYGYLAINLAIVNGALGDRDTAERHFQRAQALLPAYAGSHFYYGRWLIDEGRAAEALPHLERAAALSPGAPEPRHVLMNLRYAEGNDAAVAALADEMLAVAPDDRVALAYRSGAIPLVNHTAGIEDLRQRGEALAAKERHLDAAVVYRYAVARNPQDVEALKGLRATLEKLGLKAASGS